MKNERLQAREPPGLGLVIAGIERLLPTALSTVPIRFPDQISVERTVARDLRRQEPHLAQMPLVAIVPWWSLNGVWLTAERRSCGSDLA